MYSLSLHRHACLPALISATLLFAAAQLSAAPIALPLFDPSQYEIVGDLQVQQSGNEITGDYQLDLPPPEPGNNDFMLVESGNQITGDFQLTETPGSYPQQEDFNAQLESGLEYQMTAGGSEVLGDFTLSQAGNEITGAYQIAAPTGPSVPEPAGVPLFAAGAGLVAFSRLLARRCTARSARGITV